MSPEKTGRSTVATSPTAAGAPPSDAQAACTHRDAFDILAHCHEHILFRLAALEETAGALRLQGAWSDALLASLCDVLVFLDTAIPMHSADEERSLFPRLRRCPPFLDHGGDTPMDCMESEHRQHQRLLAALKRAIMQRDVLATSDAAVAVVNGYRTHIVKEDEILFPWARQLLVDPAELAEMTREMRARREAVSLKSC
jgi:iron-sulfur cluster repair protein YtfE (RIC family)